MATATASNAFLSGLETSPHEFLQPSLPLYTDAVAYLKNILDPIAKDVSQEQLQRSKESRKKRKRVDDVSENVLRLKQIHTEGFGMEQVWEQARRVIDAAREEAERSYEEAQARQTIQNGDRKAGRKSVKFAEDEESEEDSDDELGVEGEDYEVEGIDDGEEVYDEEEDEDGLEDDEDVEFDMEGPDDFDEMNEDDDVADDQPAEEFVSDKFGLNDGFFSIDNFNKQSEFLEQQDARGEDDGAASDEEEIDWDADPSTQATAGADANGDVEDEVEEDDEDGPTFGDPDAESEDDNEEIDGGEMDGLGAMGNTNDIMYADFFAPPASKKKKNKKGRPNPHNFPEPSTNGTAKPDDDEMERTMAAVHRDLFDESEEEEKDDNEEQQKLDPSDPRSRKSTHERRKLQLMEEIRKLEAANVAKREWQLTGEARAADRPINSLLEEDLEFERAGKPVPVITAEVSESIEELIKRRILAHDFQDILRRRPDDLATGSRRGKQAFELDDQKSKKGLAEEYEEEHLRRTDPNFVDVKDEKLQKEQKEIEALWKEVSAQLDSLSSWHFRPKPAAPTLDIRVDAPAITMEDARPSAGGEAATSQLAPQEIYKAGEASNKKEEVVGKSGLPAGREEMSRDEKKRRRRREKERIRKASGNEDPKAQSKSGKTTKKNVVEDLKRGGVKVINRKGELKDVEGRSVGDKGSGQGAAQFKL